MNRYRSDKRIKAGSALGTNQSINRIRRAIREGRISVRDYVLKENERLDILAHRYFGDGDLWWILAASSDIGWNLQVPPGTKISIPRDLNLILALI